MLIHPELMLDDGYDVPNSGVFANEDSDRMVRTFGTPTNQYIWTMSVFVKNISGSADSPVIFGNYASSISHGRIHFETNGQLRFVEADPTTDINTLSTFRDTAQFLHVVVTYDRAQVVQADRLQMFVNGVLQPVNQVNGIGTTDNGRINRAQNHYIGAKVTSTQNFDGYMSELHFVDGQRLTPEDFAQADPATGQWVAKKYQGTYGSNGFYLNFQNGANLGEDSSGNGNDFTNTGVTQSTDTPTDNHATLNFIDPLTTATITDAGLTSASGNATVTLRPETGKWYYEKGGVGVNYDCSVSGTFNPTLTADTYTFAEVDWAGSPTAGFLALSTKNLPEPTITKPTDYFAPIIYDDGVGAKTVGFQPDMVWFKTRGSIGHHKLVDSVRGATIAFTPSASTLEATEATGLTSFDTNGFTVGADSLYSDTTGVGMVAWSWKKGITPGLDIVSYTGTGANQAVAHDVGSRPEMVFFMARDTTANEQKWVYHTSSAISRGWYLDSNVTRVLDATVMPALTTTTVTVGTSTLSNENTKDYVAYLFSEVEGFSKIDSYTGNGLADGVFVYCGFRPAYVLIKRSTSAGSWYMYDTARSTYNLTKETLVADGTAAEVTTISEIDILSNGFKLRAADAGVNTSASVYIFLAFAESPFKYSRAR